VDTQTEAIIQNAMETLMAGRTTFVIAHRLSTIRDASEVLVLDNGHIVERGNHHELLRMGGKYHNLYTLGLALGGESIEADIDSSTIQTP
jgi:ATP-binding cassette subfamily B protein